MCNQYKLPAPERLFKDFHLSVPDDYRQGDVFPQSPGYFVRRSTAQAGFARELVRGQWGLVPWFAKSPRLKYQTNNARSEELESKASFPEPWAWGQRCVIPVSVFWEPCWESGRNVWWSFARADGLSFGLAALWNTWVDKATGEVLESYTLLTMNADSPPLFNRMHKPDPKLPPDQQYRRMVAVLEPALWDVWLESPLEVAKGLIVEAPASAFAAAADPQRRAASEDVGPASGGGSGGVHFLSTSAGIADTLPERRCRLRPGCCFVGGRLRDWRAEWIAPRLLQAT